MDNKKCSITIEFPEEMFMKDFIDTIEHAEFAGWIEFKIIRNPKRELTSIEKVIKKVRKALEELDGTNH